MSDKFTIRRMNLTEIQIALNWAHNEGWNPGINDETCFYNADPQGFFVGCLNGEPIATGAAVVYDAHYAFCGLYIVKPEFRAHGYGIQLTEERLKYVGNRITGLDGVLDKVSKYQRLGYVPAHKNIRYEWDSKSSFHLSPSLIDLKTLPFEQLEKFDRKYFPAPRSAFLKLWIHQPESYALGYHEDKNLRGYGVIRKCYQGYKIGPLFAESSEIAQALFEGLCSQINDGPVYLDVPEPNQNGKLLIDYNGMIPKFEVIRMYRNGFPTIDLQGIYGITTFELG